MTLTSVLTLCTTVQCTEYKFSSFEILYYIKNSHIFIQVVNG